MESSTDSKSIIPITTQSDTPLTIIEWEIGVRDLEIILILLETYGNRDIKDYLKGGVLVTLAESEEMVELYGRLEQIENQIKGPQLSKEGHEPDNPDCTCDHCWEYSY